MTDAQRELLANTIEGLEKELFDPEFAEVLRVLLAERDEAIASRDEAMTALEAARGRLAAISGTGDPVDCCPPIHLFFNLTYASYLVIPRTLLQSMPADWQARFVAMLGEIGDRFGDWPEDGYYDVRLKDDRGRYVADPLADYERGRRVVPGRGAEPTAGGQA